MPNEGLEKPNSELPVQDLESYFCRRRLSYRGTISFFDSIYRDDPCALQRYVPRGEARFMCFA